MSAAANNNFRNWAPNWQSPYMHAFSISPSDSANVAHVTRAILAGNTGDVKVDLAGSSTHAGQTGVILYGLVKGSVYKVAVKKVYSTGTTSGMKLTGLY